MLFVKYSVAREVNIAIDSVNAAVKHISQIIEKDSILQSTLTSDTLKNSVKLVSDPIVKDSIVQTKIIADTPKVAPNQVVNNSIEQSKVVADTVKLVPNRIVKNPIIQSKVTFDVGPVFSTFKYIDIQGNQGQSYTHNITSAYSLGYWFSTNDKLFYHAKVGLRDAGASLRLGGVNYNWTIQYLDASLGVGYVLNLWRIKPYFSASPYFGYVLKANQRIGSADYDIKENKSMKTTDFGVFFSPGVKLAASDYISFYAEYKYILGLTNLETGTRGKSYNRGFAFNLGVAITFQNQ